MEFFTAFKPERSSSLGMALVVSSATPLLLLSEKLVVQAASQTFCCAFDLRIETVVGEQIFAIGNGEWNAPQLRSLLEATANGLAAIDAYEFTLKRVGQPDRTLVLNAHILDYADDEEPRLVLAVSDITAIRDSETAALAAAHEHDTLVRDKQILRQELNHRVANSLQIIASILMQRVRGVESEETRTHLRDAHHRVMSIATLQRLLASSATSDVPLRRYLTDLCASIAASMIADPAKLTLNVVVDDSVMSPDQSVSLGLIVTELVINSLKHAFPDIVQPGKIDVTFASGGTGWTLTVADDGIGLPADQAKAKPGLGTGIVNALASQLSATVTVSDAHRGTTVVVRCSADSAAAKPKLAV